MPTFYSTDDFTSSWLAQVAAWALQAETTQGALTMPTKCSFCDKRAVTIAYYEDGWGDIVGTHRMCREHGAPCNHYADPYASFVREEPLNDVEAEDNQG